MAAPAKFLFDMDFAAPDKTRAPAITPAEIAESIGATSEEVLEALEAAVAYEPVSLDTSPGSEDEDETWAQSIGAEDPGYELAEYSADLAPAMRALPERERLILHMRFVQDMTQSEIADRVGISQMHVSRLLAKTLVQLREGLGDAR